MLELPTVLKPSAALIVESNHTILAAARPFVILHGLRDLICCSAP
jgi:hypothetical protein